MVQGQIQEWPVDDDGIADLVLVRKLGQVLLLLLLVGEEGQWARLWVKRVASVFGGDEALDAGADGRVQEKALMAEMGVIQGRDDSVLAS